MGDVAIKVDGLGKRYALGAEAPYATLRESLGNLVRLRPRAAQPTMWAVKDVSFSVKQGETVGIIGRNGAGKSTLLKMLSRITTPSTGRIEVTGRLASLLEVGTGFHPELTGRENVFLNGGILGMTRPEIRARFDEIVAFAEVEKFIDTAVKHYSSGMYLRLAFAVAAHLEPEILIVDEVLAVGDASFQRKCLNKMEDAGRSGRAVLFVSHNLQAVTRLCARAIYLRAGAVVSDGLARDVVAGYLHESTGTRGRRVWDKDPPGNEHAALLELRVVDQHGESTDAVDVRARIGIRFVFESRSAQYAITPNFFLYDSSGYVVFGASLPSHEWRTTPTAPGKYTATAWIPADLLAEGTFTIGAALSTMDPVIVHCFERDAISFQAIQSDDGLGARGNFGGDIPGVVRPLLTWDAERVFDASSTGVQITTPTPEKGRPT